MLIMDDTTISSETTEKKRNKTDCRISIISIILATSIGLIGIVIALTSWQDSHPYFIITHEIDTDNTLHVILRNEGKPIRRARCKELCFAVIAYNGNQVYIPVTHQAHALSYDYDNNQFDIPQFSIDLMVHMIKLGEPFWRFNLEETLYSKMAEENGQKYSARSIDDFFFANYYIVSYIDYRDRQRTEVFRQYTDDDYDRITLSDIPESKDTTLNQPIESIEAIDFCAYVFTNLGVQFEIEDGQFIFIR